MVIELNSPIPVHFSLLIPRMLMFTLAISFDHFQFALIHGPNIPSSYAILLFTASNLASVTTPIHNWVLFCFGSIPPFFLELFLHWSPVAYWAPTDLGSSSFSILSFCLFILFMGFSRQEYWRGFPFPSPVDHILSDLSTMTHPSWVAPRAWLSFIELDKAVVHVIRLTSLLWVWFQCVCPLMPPCNTYRLTGVSLTLDVGYLFTAAPAKRGHCSSPWMRSLLLTLNME